MASVEKTLSANDTGETGGHQAGLLIPKENQVLRFFPPLDPSVKNPRAVVDVVDPAGEEWTFNYIYYNNRLFGGTRNEFRLTCMTDFIRRYALKTGDTVVFTKGDGRRMTISYRRKDEPVREVSGQKILRLSGNWTVVETDQFL